MINPANTTNALGALHIQESVVESLTVKPVSKCNKVEKCAKKVSHAEPKEAETSYQVFVAFIIPFLTTLLGLAIAMISNWCNGVYS